jgi:hypothetical protein
LICFWPTLWDSKQNACFSNLFVVVISKVALNDIFLVWQCFITQYPSLWWSILEMTELGNLTTSQTWEGGSLISRAGYKRIDQWQGKEFTHSKYLYNNLEDLCFKIPDLTDSNIIKLNQLKSSWIFIRLEFPKSNLFENCKGPNHWYL